MAEIKVLPITLLLFCLVTSESGSMAQKMHKIKPEKDLVSRIIGEKDNGGLMDCWNALLELKSHYLPPQTFASGNEVAMRSRRRKRGCCQKLLPPYLLLRPETAILVAGICFCSSESEVCRKC
ncbi:hypothetical protein Tco_0712315 [Tanacetum coccineum]